MSTWTRKDGTQITNTVAVSGNVNAILTGGVAVNATASGNPMIGGLVAMDIIATAQVVSAGNVTYMKGDRIGRTLTNEMHPNSWVAFSNETAATAAKTLRAAPGAGLSLYITDVVISNGSAQAVINMVEDTTAAAVAISQNYYLIANGGFGTQFKTPKKLTANKAAGFTSTGATTHSVEIHGYTDV